jgi:uncharacterized protein (TIGR02147 family)
MAHSGTPPSAAALRRAAGTVRPSKFLDHREYLGAVYRALKQSFGAYSYLRFTEDLGFGRCNALYLVIHGERPLTVKGAQKIVSALGLRALERQYFLKLVEFAHLTDSAAREAAFDALVALKSRALPTVLEKRQLAFYDDWYNAAILELLASPDAVDDPDWIAARLLPRVAPAKVRQSLVLLQELGHLTFDVYRKRLVPTEQVLTTGSEVIGMAVVRYHQQMIELGKESITRVEQSERDVSGLTVRVSKELKSKLKAEIIAFRQRIMELSKTVKDSDEIVQLNIQLFPVATGIGGGSSHDE